MVRFSCFSCSSDLNSHTHDCRRFSFNMIECPRHYFYPTLSTWNKPSLIPPSQSGSGIIMYAGRLHRVAVSLLTVFSFRYADYNYLCLPGNTSRVACPSLLFGPGPPETGVSRFPMFRIPCRDYPWTCAGRQPALDAACTSSGNWFIPGSLDTSLGDPVIIGGNTTVLGNLTIPVGTGLTIKAGSTITVQGCVSISGDLTIDVSQNKPPVNGTIIDVLFFNSTCNSTDVPEFRRVSVVGTTAADCFVLDAQDQLSSKGLSVVFTVYSVQDCGKGAPSIDGVSSSTAAIIGGVVGAVAFIGVVVTIVLLYRYREKLIPSFRLRRGLTKLKNRGSLQAQ
jgi:hypothetical protein